ncbi:HAMP domain-containing sensor histidine kinase [Oceanirhabdus sp. W0125-5]|uniref:HAMP domain-containing sensor histidine kinase n=1 Tax=Oceanirhabdus sp. W0125-5 TaxID=2999116 RepID=UPI0022F30297|nr:HAMP domain-containing sensor histidine kinase [Oceanirhabdus sp. W0125-5]WBW97648.1 HAMP domain-containing sensor histidine kinase [Oceanirhabdus sp. W0125-5]
MFVYHKFTFNNKQYYLKTIRDISVVDSVSKENSKVILNISLVVSIIIIILTLILTSILMNPITKLTKIVKYISSGNYSKRINLKHNKNDELGELSNYFNIMADVIEDKISTLEDENQRKQSFINNLSHEIRTPLTSIIGFSDLLKNMDYNKESFDKGLNFINSEGKRLLNISKLLLHIARLKEENIEFEKVDSSILLKEIYDTMKIKHKSSNILLELHLSSENYLFNINKDMITLAICNLIDNAFNASKENDLIVFGTAEYNNKPCIFVKDNGIGMNEDDINKIFDPFYRIDKARSRKNGGAGLGLSICTEIMNLHDGKIIVESKLNKGTTFYLIF